MRWLVVAVLTALTCAGNLGAVVYAEGPLLPGFVAGRGSSVEGSRTSHVDRLSHRGWTFHSTHAHVVATTRREDAAWVAGQLERTWAEVARLADQWTDVHRRPGFGHGALSVVVTNEPLHPRSMPSGGAFLRNPEADIFVNLAAGSARLEDRLPAVRAEVFAAFLRVARQDLTLPLWVQTGLAAYFSGEPLPETSPSRLDPPAPFVPPTKGAWARLTLPERGHAPAKAGSEDVQAAFWVRYLLEGDDAVHAYDFFDAMAAAVARRPGDEMSFTQKARAVPPLVKQRAPDHPVSFQQLLAERIRNEDVAEWLADRNVGQPILNPHPADLALDKRHLEMVLILKLARRFGAADDTRIQPKVYYLGGQEAVGAAAVAATRNSLDVSALYRRLSDPAHVRWATIDTDGRLLLATDAERLLAVFAPTDRAYRTYQQEGRAVLEAAFATGEVYQAWLEENPANPKRPIAHLQIKSSQTRTASGLPATTERVKGFETTAKRN